MPKPDPSIFIHAALPCEARPLIDHFRLKKDLSCHAFEIYGRGEICLTVTGIGKCAMAAGVAYTQASIGAAATPIMVNIGIAGHAELDVGRILLAGRILDADTRKNYYPPLAFTPPCAVESLRTASRPQLDYTEPYLYDMEGSSFYETAQRFSTGELIQTLKVVSDNRYRPAENIEPRQVASLIAAELTAVELLLAELRHLRGLIFEPEPKQFRELIERFRLTANEKLQLRSQLLRWECLTSGESLDLDHAGIGNGKDLLAWLARQIDSIEYTL